MGKNWFIALAACMVVMSIIIGSINQVGGHDEIVSGIAGNKAYAQELNPDRTMALIAKGGITNDSVMEQSIVSQTASIAGTQQIRVWVTAYTSDPLETDDTPHISEVKNGFVQKITDVLKDGQIVRAKVVKVDENGKIGLSIKALSSENPQPKTEAK